VRKVINSKIQLQIETIDIKPITTSLLNI